MRERAKEAIDEAAMAWFVRLRDAALPAAERAQFARWLAAAPAHRRAWADVESLWSSMDALHPAPAVTLGPRMATQGRNRAAPLVALAASLALVIAGAWLMVPPTAYLVWADYRTGAGEQRPITLPDGSQVTLDAASALSLHFSDTERRVKLDAGRAFFALAPDAARPFILDAAQGEIRDVGTKFNAALAEDGVDVAVMAGRVEIRLGDSSDVAALSAGEALHYGATLEPRRTLAAGDTAWLDHRLIFQDAPLGDVLDAVERYRGGRILLVDRALAARTITGAFDTRRPDEVLDALTHLLPVTAMRLPGGLVILRRAD
jgi:transmembrane sensor